MWNLASISVSKGVYLFAVLQSLTLDELDGPL